MAKPKKMGSTAFFTANNLRIKFWLFSKADFLKKLNRGNLRKRMSIQSKRI